MEFSPEQIAELKTIVPELATADEGGNSFILLKNCNLPGGCTPSVADLLLCAVPRDGYESRLFFPVQIAGGPARNWNGNLRLLDKNWFAFSWRTASGLRLAEMLVIHLNGLRHET